MPRSGPLSYKQFSNGPTITPREAMELYERHLAGSDNHDTPSAETPGSIPQKPVPLAPVTEEDKKLFAAMQEAVDNGNCANLLTDPNPAFGRPLWVKSAADVARETEQADIDTLFRSGNSTEDSMSELFPAAQPFIHIPLPTRDPNFSDNAKWIAIDQARAAAAKAAATDNNKEMAGDVEHTDTNNDLPVSSPAVASAVNISAPSHVTDQRGLSLYLSGTNNLSIVGSINLAPHRRDSVGPSRILGQQAQHPASAVAVASFPHPGAISNENQDVLNQTTALAASETQEPNPKRQKIATPGTQVQQPGQAHRAPNGSPTRNGSYNARSASEAPAQQQPQPQTSTHQVVDLTPRLQQPTQTYQEHNGHPARPGCYHARGACQALEQQQPQTSTCQVVDLTSYQHAQPHIQAPRPHNTQQHQYLQRQFYPQHYQQQHGCWQADVPPQQHFSGRSQFGDHEHVMPNFHPQHHRGQIVQQHPQALWGGDQRFQSQVQSPRSQNVQQPQQHQVPHQPRQNQQQLGDVSAANPHQFQSAPRHTPTQPGQVSPQQVQNPFAPDGALSATTPQVNTVMIPQHHGMALIAKETQALIAEETQTPIAEETLSPSNDACVIPEWILNMSKPCGRPPDSEMRTEVEKQAAMDRIFAANLAGLEAKSMLSVLSDDIPPSPKRQRTVDNLEIRGRSSEKSQPPDKRDRPEYTVTMPGVSYGDFLFPDEETTAEWWINSLRSMIEMLTPHFGGDFPKVVPRDTSGYNIESWWKSWWRAWYHAHELSCELHQLRKSGAEQRGQADSEQRLTLDEADEDNINDLLVRFAEALARSGAREHYTFVEFNELQRLWY